MLDSVEASAVAQAMRRLAMLKFQVPVEHKMPSSTLQTLGTTSKALKSWSTLMFNPLRPPSDVGWTSFVKTGLCGWHFLQVLPSYIYIYIYMYMYIIMHTYINSLVMVETLTLSKRNF